jgi:hypothetical protein
VYAAPPLVSCDSAIILVRPAAPSRYDRVLFGRVSIAGRDRVPGPSRLPSGGGPFAYFAKTGVSVRRGGAGALLEVPRAWRDRVRITWGGVGPAVAVRFPGCTTGPAWTTYAGGFLFRNERGGCVPLRITVGSKMTIVRFAAGRRC